MDAIINAHVAISILVAIIVSLALHLGLAFWRAAPALSGAAALLAYAVAHVVLKGWPELPPKNVMEWPVFLALGAAVLLALSACRDRWARMIALVIIAIASPILILNRLPDFQHGGLMPTAAAFAAATIVAALTFERACAAWSPLVQRALITSVTVAGVGALLLAGSFEIAQRGMLVAAAAGAPLALNWWRGSVAGAPTAATIAMSWMWILAYALSSLDPAHGDPSPRFAFVPAMILLALAPLASFAARPLAANRPRLATAAAVLATLVVAGGAVGWVWVRGQPATHGIDTSEY